MSAVQEQHYVFRGEMQLLAWSETSAKGATVSLQLADADELEAFKTMTLRKGKQCGQRLMVVMVQVGDEDEPVAQASVGLVAGPARKGGALAVLSGQWCQMARFQEWLRERNHATWQRGFEALTQEGDSTLPAEIAAEVVRQLCGVKSRSELDHDAAAAALFHQYVRLPFAALMDAERN